MATSKPSDTWSDVRLVKECLSGHEEAWSCLIEKYKALIYSIPVKYGLSPEVFETPPRPYAEVAEELGLAPGSIGFTRKKCIERLRRQLEKSFR